jgi:2-phosphoglycolate phosphatase
MSNHYPTQPEAKDHLMTLDAILFDLDGTLIDSCADIAAAANYTLRQLGRDPVCEAKVRAVIGEGVHALARFLGDSVSEIEEAMQICGDYYSRHFLDQTRLYPGVRQLLASTGDVPLAIISNKPEALCRAILEGLGIAHRFALIAGCDTYAAAKPSPLPIRETLARLQTSSYSRRPRAIMIGDTPTDIFAARMAPVPSLGVTWGYSSASELRVACAESLCHSPHQLRLMLGTKLAPSYAEFDQHAAVG